MIRLPWWFPPTHVPSLDLQRSGEKYVWSVVDETLRERVKQEKLAVYYLNLIMSPEPTP